MGLRGKRVGSSSPSVKIYKAPSRDWLQPNVPFSVVIFQSDVRSSVLINVHSHHALPGPGDKSVEHKP